MAWRRPADKPLPAPMMVSLLTLLCVTRCSFIAPTVLCCAKHINCLQYVDGLVQDCSNSSALAMELLQYCTKPSMYGAVITGPIKAIMQENWQSATVCVCTVYPKKYAHRFVVLCFVVVTQSFIMNSHEVFIHIHQCCFAGTGAIVRLPQCQWSKPDGYGKISQCITTTKHSKAKTACIFLGIYGISIVKCEVIDKHIDDHIRICLYIGVVKRLRSNNYSIDINR